MSVKQEAVSSAVFCPKKAFAAKYSVDWKLANWDNRAPLSQEAIQEMAKFYGNTLRGSRWLKPSDYNLELVQDAFNREEDRTRREAVRALETKADRLKHSAKHLDFSWLEHRSGFRVPCIDPAKSTLFVETEPPASLKNDVAQRVYIITSSDLRMLWGFGAKHPVPPSLQKRVLSSNSFFEMVDHLLEKGISDTAGDIDYSKFPPEFKIFLPDYLLHHTEIQALQRLKQQDREKAKQADSDPTTTMTATMAAPACTTTKQVQYEERQFTDDEWQFNQLQIVCALNDLTTSLPMPYISDLFSHADGSIKSSALFPASYKFPPLGEFLPADEAPSLEEAVRRFFAQEQVRGGGETMDVDEEELEDGAITIDLEAIAQTVRDENQAFFDKTMKPYLQGNERSLQSAVKRTEASMLTDDRLMKISGQISEQVQKDVQKTLVTMAIEHKQMLDLLTRSLEAMVKAGAAFVVSGKRMCEIGESVLQEAAAAAPAPHPPVKKLKVDPAVAAAATEAQAEGAEDESTYVQRPPPPPAAAKPKALQLMTPKRPAAQPTPTPTKQNLLPPPKGGVKLPAPPPPVTVLKPAVIGTVKASPLRGITTAAAKPAKH